MDDARDWARELAAALDGQQALYADLDELSRRQRTLIDDEDETRLLEVLGRRQVIVDRIVAGNTGLAALRGQWGAMSPALAASQRDDLKRRLEALVALAGAIAARDDDDRREMEGRRDRIGVELAGMTRRRGAAAAYAGAPRPAGPRFADQEA
jgi:hypothetical protein